MKKLFLLATAAFLFTGIALAHDGDKKCTKACCKKDEKACCSKDAKSAKTTDKAAVKTTTKTTKA